MAKKPDVKMTAPCGKRMDQHKLNYDRIIKQAEKCEKCQKKKRVR